MKPLDRFSDCILISLLLLLAIGGFARNSAAIGEGLELAEEEPLKITAESLTYYEQENLFVAEGFVEITYRTTRLTADRIEFNEETGDALAIGNVLYEETGEIITAEQGEFNFDTDRGIVLQGFLSLEEDHYITGKEIEKIGDKTYFFRRGTYTACDSSWPAWKFWCTSAKIHDGGYLQSWNTVGFIQGIPVLYLPYFIYPVKNERQTGFLIPDVGRSSTLGYTISNSFFWAITKSQDATLSHRYYEERGHKVELEYRYKYSKNTDGTFNGQYIRDKLTLEERKRLRWNHRHGLPYSIKARVNLNLTSDDQFDEDFETKLEDRTDQKLDSDISFTRNFSRHTALLLFDRSDDLRAESNDRTDQRFPEFSFTSQKQQVFGLPLYFNQKTVVSRLKRDGNEDERLDFIRIDTQPTVSLSLNIIGQALTLNPEFQFRETYYTRDADTAADPDLEAEPVHREYYKTAVELNGPKFSRIFDFGIYHRLQKLKHLIEPSLEFKYKPKIGMDEDDLPKFDGTDRIGSNKQRTIYYDITQRLLAKQVKKSEWERYLEDEELSIDELGTETKELASFKLSQSYNLETEEYKFSNIKVSLKTHLFENYDLGLESKFDPYMSTFVSTNIDFNGKLWNLLDFGIKWRRSSSVDRDTEEITDVNQFLDLNTSLSLFNKVNISYRGRFNVEEDKRIEDNIGLAYNAQCWNIIGHYTQQLIGDDDEREEIYHVTLGLKHLGQLFKWSQSTEQ